MSNTPDYCQNLEGFQDREFLNDHESRFYVLSSYFRNKSLVGHICCYIKVISMMLKGMQWAT